MKYKDSKIYNKYLEYNSNPKVKTIISLSFWLLFFFAVVLFARFSNRSISNNSGNYISDRVNSYEFTYMDDKAVIYGKTFNGIYVYNVLNSKYYYNGKILYEIKNHDAFETENEFLNYLKISYQMINDLTENLDYSVSENSLVYNVPLSNFLNLYDNDVPLNLEEAEKYNIIINKYYMNDILYMVKIDLSNYYLFTGQENKGLLTINFYEQNKINDFTSEYDRIVGVIE